MPNGILDAVTFIASNHHYILQATKFQITRDCKLYGSNIINCIRKYMPFIYVTDDEYSSNILEKMICTKIYV